MLWSNNELPKSPLIHPHTRGSYPTHTLRGVLDLLSLRYHCKMVAFCSLHKRNSLYKKITSLEINLNCFGSAGSFGPTSFLNDSHVTLSWDNAFSYSETGVLVYEVFAGAIEGAAAGFPSLLTKDTTHVFSRGRVARGTPYYVTVKAIALSGKYLVKEDTITAN